VARPPAAVALTFRLAQLWRMLALRAQTSPFRDGRRGSGCRRRADWRATVSDPALGLRGACARSLDGVLQGSPLARVWKGSLELHPHTSYTGLCHTSVLQPDPSRNHNHCCSSRKLLSRPLLARTVSPCLPAATQNPPSPPAVASLLFGGRY
jgi:hypothetical protein